MRFWAAVVSQFRRFHWDFTVTECEVFLHSEGTVTLVVSGNKKS